MEIVTDRLVIRTFTADDLPEFKKLLDIPEVRGWQMQKKRAQDFLNWHLTNYEKMDVTHGIVCLGIFDKATGALLGSVGAGEHDDLHETEIFYALLPSARGKKYAQEAALAVTKWALQHFELPYIIATAGVDNIASQKVLEHCGYELVGERNLKVHILNKRAIFKYYRRYPNRRE
jgi:RimJ/RimL family protein N-acetyltransferase